MPTQLSESAAAELTLTAVERVVTGAMTVTLLRRDHATLVDRSRRATRAAGIAAGVGAVCDALSRAGGDPRTAGLAAALAASDQEYRAALVDDAVVGLASLVTSRPRALLVLLDACLSTPARTSWNGRARRRALRELTAALPGLDAVDMARVPAEVATARRGLARRRITWGRVAPACDPGTGADEVLRLAVATRLVVIGEHRDDESAARVVRGLRERLDAVTARRHELADRLGDVERTAPRVSPSNRRRWIALRAEQGGVAELGAALEAALDLLDAPV